MIIVLVTKGKNESVDYAKVVQFEERFQAEAYVKMVSTGKRKHWQTAVILERDGDFVELCSPEDK